MINKWSKPSLGQSTDIELDDGSRISLLLKNNARAKRYVLRYDIKAEKIIVTLPPRGNAKQAKSFAQENIDWIATRIQKNSNRVPFTPNNNIPLRGVPHVITSTGLSRGITQTVSGAPPQIIVSGELGHFSRRVEDFLKSEALKDYQSAVHKYCITLGVSASAIRLRDGKSRWGSCSAKGILNFSWRLVMAPPEVLDYLAAHEVSHLLEMNHSDRFWAHVEKICPNYKVHQKWLKSEGSGLWRYG